MLGLGLGLAARGRRFDPARLFANGEAGAWYDPADLGSMFQDEAGILPAAVGAPVGRIADKSGRGNHAAQAAAAARPLLRETAAGRRYLEFDGVDDTLSASFAIAQPIDRLSAIRQLAWTSSGRIFGAPTANAGALYMVGAAPRIGIYSGTPGVGTNGVAVGADAVVTERHHDAASRVAANGEAYASGPAGVAAPDGVSLGAWGSLRGNVRIYGMLMIGRALSEAEIADLRGFMAGRAGVSI